MHPEKAKFLSTPSGWRATAISINSADQLKHFYPRPPGGGRHRRCSRNTNVANFYPRPPGGGRHITGLFTVPTCNNFYPRPPGGGRRLTPNDTAQLMLIFLSTPSGWRATWCAQWNDVCQYISIHALRVEGDCTINANCPGDDEISIHALRVEGDNRQFPHVDGCSNFYPRPPGGGRHVVFVHLAKVSRLFLSTPSGWRATV